MIRRKIWASVTCCLALGGMVSAQDSTPKPASLGKPQAVPNYTARGAGPDYPMYTPPPARMFAPAGSIRTTNFATDGDSPKVPILGDGPKTPMPPMGMPSGVIAPPVPDPKDKPKTMPMTMPPNGMLPVPTPIITSMSPTPFLDQSGMPMDCPPVMAACAPCCDLPCAWIAPEYIHWRTRGANLPPMVSTAPAQTNGALSNPEARVLFGGEPVLDNWRSGIRVRAGAWFDRTNGLGVDAGFFHLGGTRSGISVESDGNPGLFRPFTNADGTPNAELVALIAPGGTPIVAGRVTVSASNEFLGADANFRQVLNCENGNHVDLIVGYRYLRLRDTLSVREDLRATDPNEFDAPLGTRITVFDSFQTINQFHGGQIGIAGEWKMGNFFVNYRGTVALGINHIRTKIDGATSVATPDGAVVNSQGGLLALPTNIGSYSAHRFSIVPEVGLNVGYDLTKNVRIFGGYNFLYWTNIARASEQIDPVLNTTFIPDPEGNAPTGVRRPAYNRTDTNFWAHGWNFGVEFRW